ncbi:phosphatase PAP2 family protein [Amycolatopsis sp. NPDC059657]|uniref:phosphatase PAP2 family protein n=1 Tax=Amycolatopsis sp. NPDC059657 TaxID=3346899 RepID=UPI00366CC255
MSQTLSTDRTTNPGRRAVARLATEVLAPWVWVLGLPLVVAWEVTGHHLGETLLWGLITGVTGSLIPMAVIVHGARQGKWDSHHVTDRAGRVIPFAACISSLAGGIVLLVIGNAPHEMVSLAGAEMACLFASVAITFALKFKISMHAVVAAGATVMLVFVYGPLLLLLIPLVAWVCWSRVELDDHTTAQVISGAVLGAVLGGAVYLVLDAALR